MSTLRLTAGGGAAFYVASPRRLSGVAAVMQGRMPTFTSVFEQHENGEQASLKGVADLFMAS